ncbi:UDP-3-O-(3-hydroxymyristoyl)glucosamine N-acyltransferase [Leptolyngbya sp. CCY15150]|uniref:UDP-3-O-(3-hydroxymyristoyl)glucosamine N-acyltransferase n=1 Tax=Leptolyngbya sp. CCY15150 TaxID=2767772 RepID=UPI0019500485|nr:UDP-3-O-(3-hydroxymyristoyl)glucosamine N-acyltransferase [Leptolyngbya sp. CCY15150]
MPTINLSQIAQHLQSQHTTAQDPEISGVAAIDEAQPGQLSYIEGETFAAQIATTQASALILPMNEALQAAADARQLAWVSVPQPRLAFAQAIALFYQPFKPAPGIHPSAVIDPSVQLGEGVSIGAHVVIQAGVRLGDGVCIHPNVVVYPGVQIGDRSLLHANCVIHERTILGTDCVIHSGACIGAEGFGFVPTAEGWFKMEQSGQVVLEDGVEIGCNSAVDRPAVGETRIRRHTKLDNLVHVAHGCQIGEACAMAAQVGLAGGVKVGNRVILAGQVGIANQVTIGDGAIATAQTGVHRDVEPGAIVSGYPAIPNRLWLKISAVYNRLPDMYQSLREIRRQLK